MPGAYAPFPFPGDFVPPKAEAASPALPLADPAGRLMLFMPGFFAPAEAAALLNTFETCPQEPTGSATDVSKSAIARPGPGGSLRASPFSPASAQSLLSRILGRCAFPASWGDPCACNSLMRFIRYFPGCGLVAHDDLMRFYKIPGREMPGQSRATFLAYLESPDSGGETLFFPDRSLLGSYGSPNEAFHCAAPKAGDALVFEHGITHSALPAVRGRKTILTTEIVFAP